MTVTFKFNPSTSPLYCPAFYVTMSINEIYPPKCNIIQRRIYDEVCNVSYQRTVRLPFIHILEVEKRVSLFIFFFFSIYIPPYEMKKTVSRFVYSCVQRMHQWIQRTFPRHHFKIYLLLQLYFEMITHETPCTLIGQVYTLFFFTPHHFQNLRNRSHADININLPTILSHM